MSDVVRVGAKRPTPSRSPLARGRILDIHLLDLFAQLIEVKVCLRVANPNAFWSYGRFKNVGFRYMCFAQVRCLVLGMFVVKGTDLELPVLPNLQELPPQNTQQTVS